MDHRNRAGPYKITRRYWDAGRDVGRVYEAYNPETGAPAVVVTPGSARDWWPRGSWNLTLTAGSVPPRLTLEMTGEVDGDDLEELPELLARVTAATADVARREEGREHLVGERGRHRRERAGRRARLVRRVGLTAACVLAVVAAAVVGYWRAGPAEMVRPDGAHVAQEEPLGWTYTAGELPAAPMPARPFARQKRPPCDAKMEDELVGGCWTRLEARAPCPERAYERGEKCYLPALAEPPPGRSIGQ